MSYIFRKIIKKPHAATPEIHNGKRRRKTHTMIGSVISTFLMRCCRPRELVSAASGDELFRVLKTLLENIHGFLH